VFCFFKYSERGDEHLGSAVALQWLVWKKSFDRRVWLSLIPIVGGIVLTSVTELSFNMAGFLAAFFGCVVTSTKTILAESLLHGYNFDRYCS
jgi:solute carrier family 35 protein E3